MNKTYRSRPLCGVEAIILGLLVALFIMCMVVFGFWVAQGTGPAIDERAAFQQQQTNQILQQGDIK